MYIWFNQLEENITSIFIDQSMHILILFAKLVRLRLKTS